MWRILVLFCKKDRDPFPPHPSLPRGVGFTGARCCWLALLQGGLDLPVQGARCCSGKQPNMAPLSSGFMLGAFKTKAHTLKPMITNQHSVFSMYFKFYHNLSFVCPVVSLFLYRMDYTFFTDIRRMSHITKRVLTVKIHFTQTIFCPTLQKPPGVSPSLPFCMAQCSKGTILPAMFPSSWLTIWYLDAFWLVMSYCLLCWWSIPYDTLHYLFSESICTQCLPGSQIKITEYMYFFQVVTSGLLADLASVCVADSVANDCATIPEICAGTSVCRSNGLIHPSAETVVFCLLFLLFTDLYIWQP